MDSDKLCYNDFITNVRDEVASKIGASCNVSLNRVLKNNSVELDGILIREGDGRIMPSIYLNDYYTEYCDGTPLGDIARRVINIYKESCQLKISEDILSCGFDEIKDSIIYRLVNLEKNRLLLEDTPYLKFLDFAITFHIMVLVREDSIGAIRITNGHCAKWKVDIPTLYSHAEINTSLLCPPVLRRLEDVVRMILFGKKEENGGMPGAENLLTRLDGRSGGLSLDGAGGFMYMLTNRQSVNGATVMLYPGLLSDIKQLLGEEFCILPSSVHELILVPSPADGGTDGLKAMVREINTTQVSADEILTDNVHTYREVVSELKKIVKA